MATKKTNNSVPTDENVSLDKKPTCGIVMPISAMDGYSATHWEEVLSILTNAGNEAGFDVNLVSHAQEIGTIQKRIIKNLYQNDMVICDISGKNANVMLELGIRLAFDKPTIVVMDGSTSFSFDINPLEHIIYPRDLRFHSILNFKNSLVEKIEATHLAAKNNTLTGFIRSFGDFEAVKIEEKELTGQEFIIEQLKSIQLEIQKLKSTPKFSTGVFGTSQFGAAHIGASGVIRIKIAFEPFDQNSIPTITDMLADLPYVINTKPAVPPPPHVGLGLDYKNLICWEIEFYGARYQQEIVQTIGQKSNVKFIENL